jgi:Bacterial capsule synthesis protein PGA_cap
MFLWNEQRRTPALRFGIAGDFLPAAGLAPAPGESWTERAELVRPLFQDLEFSVANLECPVGVSGIRPKVKASLGATFAGEVDALDYLDALRASVVGIANNHLYDYGKAGAERTLQNVSARGDFSVCGFGRSLADPVDVCVRESASGVRVGIWAAGRNLPDNATRSVAGIEPATREPAAQALAQMDEAKVHCRVAFLHAGAEGTNYPDPEDVQLMDELATLGFDVIAACHSHRISGYKTVQKKNGQLAHCFYGLGSLASGVLYSPFEHEGILAAIALDANGVICQVVARPIYLDARGWGSVPSAQDSQVIAERFSAVSAAIEDGRYREAFYRDVSRDLMGMQWRDGRIAFERAGLRGILGKLMRMRFAHFRRLYHKSLASIGLG